MKDGFIKVAACTPEIQVADVDFNVDKIISQLEKCREEGVKVRCSVYDGMFHVFQMGLDLIPESREAWEAVGALHNRLYLSGLVLSERFA